MIRCRLLLTPLATSYRRYRSDVGLTVRTYLEVYVFGIRVAKLHQDK